MLKHSKFSSLKEEITDMVWEFLIALRPGYTGKFIKWWPGKTYLGAKDSLLILSTTIFYWFFLALNIPFPTVTLKDCKETNGFCFAVKWVA